MHVMCSFINKFHIELFMELLDNAKSNPGAKYANLYNIRLFVMQNPSDGVLSYNLLPENFHPLAFRTKRYNLKYLIGKKCKSRCFLA